jgi:hypothetical protein
MLKIEFRDPVPSDPCPCCGNHAALLFRTVRMDELDFGVYFARFTDKHPARVVTVMVILGNWDEDSVALDRVAFGLKLVADENGFGVQVIDAADTPWGDTEESRCKLTREKALKHPRLHDVYHLTDHIFREDQPIISFLESQRRQG